MGSEEVTLEAPEATPSERDSVSPGLAKGAIVGRYVVLAEIGRGAMGRVYSAYDPRLERRVALKILRDTSSRGVSGPRLLREAQALARLDHPNVVAVHDVGEYDEQVFVAMEFVDGTTMHAWQQDPSRSWRDIVAAYVQAAHGLAAAHDAGIVHRDFKPENVMIAEAEPPNVGRVRVMDFGLAREDITPDRDADAGTGDVALTRTGAVMGTPAYMSPEQFAGDPAVPASDQFSFCVSLYEALLGTRPFRGATLGELSAAVRSGAFELPPRRGVPRWVLEVVSRGLSVDVGRRYVSMHALVAALEGGTKGTRWALAGVAAAALAGVALVFVDDPNAPCEAAVAELERSWTPSRIEALREDFVATGHRRAEGSWNRVRGYVDAFVEGWSDGYGRVCAQWRGAIDSALLQARVDCLETQRTHLAGLLTAFENPTAHTVEFAVAAAAELPGAADCTALDSAEGFGRGYARAPVLAAQRLYAHAQANRFAGKTRVAKHILDGASAYVDVLEAPRVKADIAALQATLFARLDEPERAEAKAIEALEHAAAAGDATMIARLWLHRVAIVSKHFPHRSEETQTLLEAVRLAIVGAGNDPVLVGKLAVEEGHVAVLQGRMDDARDTAERALTLLEEASASPWALARVHGMLGQIMGGAGEYDAALEQFEAARSLIREHYGEANPAVVTHTSNLAVTHFKRGDVTAAIAECRAVDDALVAADRRQSLRGATNLGYLAVALRDQQELVEARTRAEEALAIYQALGRGDDRETFVLRAMLLDFDWQASDFDGALRRAVALEELYARSEVSEVDRCQATARRAFVLRDMGRSSEAIAQFDRALAAAAKLDPKPRALIDEWTEERASLADPRHPSVD